MEVRSASQLMVSKISAVRFVLAWFVLGSPFCALGAPSIKPRTALVIGNAKYEQAAGPLRNTRNDASAVAKTLRGLGFSVMERHDLTRDQLLKAVDEFQKTLPGAEVALFYYAGHGISIAGANYLIPLKSSFDSQGASGVTLRMLAETRLFNAEQAVAGMSAAGAACNLVILDACRNTPLGRDSSTRNALTHGGLSEMTPPAGSLIAFATDAGQTALDGEGTNGLYTSELLKHLQTRGLTIEQVFKRTRAGVLKRSAGGQVPSEYSRLVGDDIYLAGTAEVEPAVPVQRAVAVPTLIQLNKMAQTGQTEECLSGLRLLAQSRGPGAYASKLLETVLAKVKEDLTKPGLPKEKLLSLAATCEAIIQAGMECVPPGDPANPGLGAKANNRWGDALLLLERPEEAVRKFDAAALLDPADPYVLYNRGKANLALGRTEEARADFTEASSSRFNRTKAKKLAERALAEMK